MPEEKELDQEALVDMVARAVEALTPEYGRSLMTPHIQKYLQEQFGVVIPLQRIKDADDILFDRYCQDRERRGV